MLAQIPILKKSYFKQKRKKIDHEGTKHTRKMKSNRGYSQYCLNLWFGMVVVNKRAKRCNVLSTWYSNNAINSYQEKMVTTGMLSKYYHEVHWSRWDTESWATTDRECKSLIPGWRKTQPNQKYVLETIKTMAVCEKNNWRSNCEDESKCSVGWMRICLWVEKYDANICEGHYCIEVINEACWRQLNLL